MSWEDSELQKVWEKGKPIHGKDSGTWRKDCEGRTMKRDKHGDRDSQYGWEVDHKRPESRGGGDNLGNLQPLNWKSNVEKSDKIR